MGAAADRAAAAVRSNRRLDWVCAVLADKYPLARTQRALVAMKNIVFGLAWAASANAQRLDAARQIAIRVGHDALALADFLHALAVPALLQCLRLGTAESFIAPRSKPAAPAKSAAIQ